MSRHPFFHLARGPLALILGGLLSACANMADTPPGTALSEVEARYGNPDHACATDGGKQRLVWTQQPYGQFAWTTTVDQNGKIDQVVPALTDARFRALSTGTWTPEQVRCEFGPPADISVVGMPSVQQTIWSYRYKQDGVWDSLMYVYFGTDGARVTRHHAGPDPMFDPIESMSSW